MPVPTETLRNTRTVSIIFAVSSVALLASLVWMIKVDYARPWREFQDQYTDLQASLAYFDVLSNRTQESLEGLAQVQGSVDRARNELNEQQERIRRISSSLAGDDASTRKEQVAELAGLLAGPWRPAFEERARQLDRGFAESIAGMPAQPDPEALAGRVQTDADFRARMVDLLTWFDLQKLQEKADALRGDHARADLLYKGVKGDLSVATAAYEHEKSLRGEADHKTREALAQLQQVRTKVEQARLQVDALEDHRKAIDTQQKLLQADLTAAERALARVQKERDDAESRYADFSGTIQRGLFNMPMLDFAAPKGTRGRQEIRQAVLPDVRVELNFVQGYQTDRCMTCHVAIADKSFTREALSRRLEKAIVAINEELEREGRPEQKLTPPMVDDRQDLQPGQVTRGWDSLTRGQQETLFNQLRDEVNKYQAVRGRPRLEFGEPLLAHPNLELYVAPDSPHPMNRMGCTVCHEGNGEETDFVLAAHTPANHKQRHEWEERYYVRTAGLVPEQNFETAEHHWTRPMLQPEYSEAGCTKCHSKAADIAMYEGRPEATRINEGRFLFTSLGCVNCHLVEELGDSRQVGPDLSHLGEKVTRAFAENWIYFPHDYRPSTNMPHYFLQENNDAKSETGGGDSDPVLRTRTEAVAMSEYLFAVSDGYRKETPPDDLWEPLRQEDGDAAKAAAERGRRLFGSVGCLGCHSNLAFQPNDETGVAGLSLGEQWITNDLTGRLGALAQKGQLAKARWTKAAAVRDAKRAKEDPESVALDEEHQELWAIDLEEGGKGIPLTVLQEAFEAGFDGTAYSAETARLSLFKAILPRLDDKDVAGVSLTDEEMELAELSDEAWDALAEYAVERYGQMTYVQRVRYAMRYFANAYDTLFKPEATAARPVFTRFAPELSSMRTKFADYEQAVTWLYDWVKNPRHYSSYTKMPSLRLSRGEFPVVDAETGEATDETIEADEALDIAVYLATLNENAEFAEKAARRLPEQEGQDPAAYAAKRDELLRMLLGGLNSAARTEAILRDEGGDLSSRLIAKLLRSMGEAEARKRVEAMDLEQRRWMFLGDKMIGHYGCYACHQIRGYETAARPGTELTAWGEKQLTQLDFAFFEPEFREERRKDPLFKNLYPFDPAHPEDRAKLLGCVTGNPEEEVEHTLASFAWHKLRNPRIWDRRKIKGPYEKLKMPNFFLSDRQTEALVTFLLSRKPARVNSTLQVNYAGTPAGMIADGRNQARDLNCVACHQIDGNAAVMHQYIRKVEGDVIEYDEVNGPPLLRGQGAKVQSDWLYGFLNNVEMLRPWLKVRMPSFHVDNEQGTRLVEYFAGLSQHESRWLARNLAPVERYVADAQKRSTDVLLARRDRFPSAAGDEDPAADEASNSDSADSAGGEGDAPAPPPGADWHQQEGLSRIAASLRRYAVNHRLVTPSAVNPAESTPEELTAAHLEILDKAAFLQNLYDVTYPFSRSGAFVPSQAAAHDGEVLFYELKCMACHVFGDPSVPGANAAPTAPNLQLTYQRLQSAWVLDWLTAPNRIQPGTKMPNVFGMNGHASAFGDYPAEDRERLLGLLKDKSVIDDPAKQRQALTAFLYDAGAKRLDKIQPPDPAAASPEGEAEDEPAPEAGEGEASKQAASADEAAPATQPSAPG